LPDKELNIYWAGARWAITPVLTAAGAYYNIEQNSYIRAGARCTNPGSGTATQLQCAGSLNWWSATLDYQWTKRVDFYVGGGFTEESGGFTNGYTHTSTYNATFGTRFRF